MDDRTRCLSGGGSSLARDLELLRAEFEELRAELAAEVRTRRLVVVEQDGRERAVIAAHGDHGEISVRGEGLQGETTAAVLHAGDARGDEEVDSGLTVLSSGSAVSALHVVGGQLPEFWLHDGSS